MISESAAVRLQLREPLEALFADAGWRQAEARDHAEVAYAILIGLRTAAYFDGRFDLKQGRERIHE